MSGDNPLQSRADITVALTRVDDIIRACRRRYLLTRNNTS